MAKILFIGDPHLQISKLELVKDFLAWIFQQVNLINPDYVVNLGDTMHSHSVLRAEILCEYKIHVEQIIKKCQYIHVLGNHEFFKVNDSTYHALQAFKGIANYTVIDKITNDDKLGITFVPYIPKASDFPMKTLPICVAHQTFVGASFGNGFRPEDGVDADKVSADIIISGHIHGRQVVDKVIYPGTPFAQGLDDANSSKGIMIFDTDTYKYSFIESPFPRWHSLSYTISPDLNFQQMHEELVITLQDKLMQDHFVIDISGPKNEIAAYLDSPDFLSLKKNRNIRIRPTYTNLIKNDRVQIKAASVKDILSEYINKVYDGSLDKTLLLKEMSELLNDVSTLDA